MSVSAIITLDSRRLKKKTGKYPVKLLVTFDSEPKRFQTIYELTKEDYGKLTAPRVSVELQEIREKLKEIERSAGEAIKKLDPFTFEQFEKAYILHHPLFKRRKLKAKALPIVEDEFDYSPFVERFSIFKDDHSRPGTISITYFAYIKMLLREGRIGTAVSYHCSYQSIKKFRGNVRFSEITVSYLRQYEQWAKDNQISKSTIGIYLRSLRAVFNEAINEKIIGREKYPFGRKKYLIPTGKNIKKALKLEHIEQIYFYTPCCEGERSKRLLVALLFGKRH
ncbi:MAG: phage integrase SAM-like domain-containing protein [Chitinophagaceae bacterium]|nr:phage integrase SAM-like domain-containing protein [Chitinophagaceae bacterium]